MHKKSLDNLSKSENKSSDVHEHILSSLCTIYRHPKTDTSYPGSLYYLNESEVNLDILYGIESFRLWIDNLNRVFLTTKETIIFSLSKHCNYSQYRHKSPTLYIYLYIYNLSNILKTTKIQREDLIFQIEDEDKNRIFTYLSNYINYYLIKEKNNYNLLPIYEIFRSLFEIRIETHQLIKSQDLFLILYLSFKFKNRNCLEIIYNGWKQKKLNIVLEYKDFSCVQQLLSIIMPLYDYFTSNKNKHTSILINFKEVLKDLEQLDNNIINKSWIKFSKNFYFTE